jgi:hypothetical protein
VTAAEHPDLWIISDETNGDPARTGLVERSIATVLQRLIKGGSSVVMLAASPTAQPLECALDRPPPARCADPAYSLSDPNASQLNRAVEHVAAHFKHNVFTVSVDDVLCPRGVCKPVINGTLGRFDGVHYTRPFSLIIVPIILRRAVDAGLVVRHRQG